MAGLAADTGYLRRESQWGRRAGRILTDPGITDRGMPPAGTPVSRDEETLRVLGLMLVFLRICHAKAVVSLVGSDEHGRHQACIGEPYHLADGMDFVHVERPAVITATASAVHVLR